MRATVLFSGNLASGHSSVHISDASSHHDVHIGDLA